MIQILVKDLSLSLSLQALLPAAAAAHAGLFAGWKSWGRISGRQ